jgi:quinol monooxygenase YgiN
MAQIAQYARFTARPGLGEQVLALLDEASRAAAEEPGTVTYTLHVDPNEVDVVWMYELYASPEAQTAHSGSEATAKLRAGVAGLLAEPLSVTRGTVYETSPIGSAREEA